MVAERERRARLVATIATILEIATRRIPVLPEGPDHHLHAVTQPQLAQQRCDAGLPRSPRSRGALLPIWVVATAFVTSDSSDSPGQA